MLRTAFYVYYVVGFEQQICAVESFKRRYVPQVDFWLVGEVAADEFYTVGTTYFGKSAAGCDCVY